MYKVLKSVRWNASRAKMLLYTAVEEKVEKKPICHIGSTELPRGRLFRQDCDGSRECQPLDFSNCLNRHSLARCKPSYTQRIRVTDNKTFSWGDFDTPAEGVLVVAGNLHSYQFLTAKGAPDKNRRTHIGVHNESYHSSRKCRADKRKIWIRSI